MQALFTITQSPQMLAGDAVRPMRLLGAAFPLSSPAASILAPTSNGITQTVQQSSTLSSKEKVEFHIYLTRW